MDVVQPFFVEIMVFIDMFVPYKYYGRTNSYKREKVSEKGTSGVTELSYG